jgi:Transposase DDE domain
MANANLGVLQEFIETIKCVASSRDLQSTFLSHESSFTRTRKLGFAMVTYLILGLLKKSLQVELKTFFTTLELSKEAFFTKGAFSQRRHQIDSKWFKFLLEYLALLYYRMSKDITLWKGYKLIAIDGSSAILVTGKEIDEKYKGGQNKYGTYPLCRYMKMYDVLNEMTLKVEMMAMNGSERGCAYDWVDHLPNDSITLYDRGFPSFTLFFLMQSCEVPKQFIARCKRDFSKAIKDFVESAATHKMIKFYPDDRAILLLRKYHQKVTKHTYVELRVEKIMLNTGEIEILITSIIDENLLSNAEMKMLYNKRWGIETNIGKEKNILQLEHFSSHLKNGIEQDFYATFIANNIHSLILKEAQQKVDEKVKDRKYKYKINASASMHEFKQKLICLYYSKNIEKLVEYIQSVFELFIEPVRPNRKIQRKRICKRRYGKHQTQKNYRNNM